jgi:hypothetical protein
VAEDEQELTGGNASESVVRIGNTVRKPWLEKSAVVQSYLGALRAAGVDVPKPLGRDKDGRYVIEYVEGVSALDQLPLGHAELLRVGGMIRQIHDASEAVVIPNPDDWNLLLPVENPDLMCHNDLAPWNLIMGGAVGIHRLGRGRPQHSVMGLGLRRAIIRGAVRRATCGRGCLEIAGLC